MFWTASTAGFTYTGSRLAQRIKLRYMEAVLRQNMALFDVLGTGQMLSQLGADLNTIQDALSQKLSITLSAVGTLVATYIVSFALYWKLTLMLTWSFFLALALLYLGNAISTRYSSSAIDAQSSASALAENALSSIRTVTAFGFQKSILASYSAHLASAERASFTLKAIMGAMVAVTVGTGYFNVALSFWQGSRFLSDGQTSFMAIVAITLITKSAAYSVLGVGHNAETFTTAIAAARRVFRMIRRASPIDALAEAGVEPDAVQGEIRMRGVRHIYPSRPQVVVADGLDLVFAAGKTTAVVGASGSGKSSLAKLILRFYDPLCGQVCLDGRDIQELRLGWLRRQIRVVNQETYLFDASIFRNIEYGFAGTPLETLAPAAKRQRIEAAAKVACAHEFILALPDGYQTNVGTRGGRLSGGQKQRIAIARALVAEPKILVLDEATSALDTKTEASVQRSLGASGSRRTTIVIAHRLSTVQDADRIIVLKDGCVVEQGTHTDLMAHRGQYAALVVAQRTEEEKGMGTTPGSETRNGFTNCGKDIVPVPTGLHEKGPSEEGWSEKRRPTDVAELVALPESKEAADPKEEDSETQTPSLFSSLRFVWSLNAKEWPYILVGLLASIIAGLEEPASAVLFGEAVVALSRTLDDNSSSTTAAAGGSGSPRADAAFWAWMFFVLAVVMVIVFGIQGAVFARCSERLVRRARELALARMLRQEMAWFDQGGGGDSGGGGGGSNSSGSNSAAALTSFLSTEAADLAGISGATLGMILIAVSTLVSALVVGLVFGWKLALVCASLIPVLILSGFIGVWVVGEFEKLNERFLRASAAYAGEVMAAIQTVASLTMETEVLAAYEKSLDASRVKGLQANLKASLVLGLARAGVNACMGLGFWYGGKLILRGEYSLLQFVIVYSSIITSAYSAGLVFSFTPNIGKARRSATGLQRLMQRKSAIDPDCSGGQQLAAAVEGRVEFRDVSFGYPTRPGRLALHNVSFSIPARSTVAFVGQTGSGKSTIVSLLERFYEPSAGEILLDETRASSANLVQYRRCLGLVNQDPTMIQGSIRMNILAGLDPEEVTDEDIHEACRQSNIHDFVCSLP